MCKSDLEMLGWNILDIIIVTGDAVIDSPSSGVAIIARQLLSAGYRVAVIDQPDTSTDEDIRAFGEPLLFWGVTSGLVDSVVANYTASGKPRRMCDFTPGGVNNRRPDRATITYSNLIRRAFKCDNKQLIVLGGIEASLRRVTHYDLKSDKLRRPILFDSKADILLFGMADRSIIELADAIKNSTDYRSINGLAYISSMKDINIDKDKDIVLPSYEDSVASKQSFMEMFKLFFNNSSDIYSKRLLQQVADRYLVMNPPSILDSKILDHISELKFTHKAHHKYKEKVKAEETARFSITTHRGCYGDCSFCAITIHQGRRVISRSTDSILKELKYFTTLDHFKGTVSDLGGATANQYGSSCKKMDTYGACKDKKCLYPVPCKSMDISHKPLIDLLTKSAKVSGIKKIFASSGIRYDIVLADQKYGREYLTLLVKDHISGQIKLAPESFDSDVLAMMKKPQNSDFQEFLSLYDKLNRDNAKNQFISCYFLVAHPGESMGSIKNTESMIKKYLKFRPEQVQIFTPTPSTVSTAIFYTGIDMDTGDTVKVIKDLSMKNEMKSILIGKPRRRS